MIFEYASENKTPPFLFSGINARLYMFACVWLLKNKTHRAYRK